MTRFAFHQLVDICLDPQLPPEMGKAIEDQLGLMLTEPHRARAEVTIHVKPYDAAPAMTAEHRNLYEGFGEPGRYVNMPPLRLAVRKTAEGYDIYAMDMPMHVLLVMQCVLIHAGVSLVHAGAVVDPDGRVTLLPGAKNVGKTSIAGELVRHHGWQTLGDDLIALGRNGTCYSMPRAFVLKPYHRATYPHLFDEREHRDTSPLKRIKHVVQTFIYENAPFRGIGTSMLRGTPLFNPVSNLVLPSPPNAYLSVPLHELIPRKAIADTGPLGEVVLLERWQGSQIRWCEIDARQLQHHLLAVMCREWSLRMEAFFDMSIMGLFRLDDYFQRVAAILADAIGDVPMHRLLIPERLDAQQLTKAFLDRPDN